MGVIDKAKVDSKRYTQEISLTFYRVLGTGEKTIKGIATRHHLGIDGQTGERVNSRTTQCTITESLLTDQSYTTRDASGNVNLVNTYVKYADCTGVTKKYKIIQVFPDDTLGLITCVLGDLKQT